MSTRCTLDYSRSLKPTRSWRREKRFGWPDRGQTGVRLTARRGGTNIFRDALGRRYLAGCDCEESVSTGELHESAPPGVLKGSFMSCCLEEREREGRGGPPHSWVRKSAEQSAIWKRCKVDCSGFSKQNAPRSTLRLAWPAAKRGSFFDSECRGFHAQPAIGPSQKMK